MTEQLYELLQDTPSAKAGTIYVWNSEWQSYAPKNSKTYIRNGIEIFNDTYEKHEVENRHDWFKPIKDSLDEIAEETYAEMENQTTISWEKHKLKEGFTRHLNNTLEEIIKEVEKLQAYYPDHHPYAIKKAAISIIKSYIK